MRLLFVTPYFPPASGSGVPRGTKFVKYLLRIGWQVRVVTIDPSAWPDRDPDLLTEVDDAAIERVRLARIPGVEHPLLRAVPGMRRAVARAVREFRPEVVLATTPDWQWLAIDLARDGVPLVLDYPDPWSVQPQDFRLWAGPERLRSRVKWALAPRAEGRVLRRAAAAVFATDPIRDAYVRRWPKLGDRAHVITNGFDEEDFAGLEPSSHTGPLRVTHVGSFGGPRRPQTVARAVRAAAETLGDIELVLAGAGAQACRPELERILDGLTLSTPGWISHGQAIRTMLDADVLWLDAVVHLRSAATGKLFEYLRSGRPIAALAHPQSPAASLIRDLRAGAVASNEDDEICGGAIIEAARGGYGRVPAERLAPFTRQHLAAELSEVLCAQVRG